MKRVLLKYLLAVTIISTIFYSIWVMSVSLGIDLSRFISLVPDNVLSGIFSAVLTSSAVAIIFGVWVKRWVRDYVYSVAKKYEFVYEVPVHVEPILGSENPLIEPNPIDHLDQEKGYYVKCPYCDTGYKALPVRTAYEMAGSKEVLFGYFKCPNCRRMNRKKIGEGRGESGRVVESEAG